MSKAFDFELDWNSGIFSCCYDEVLNCDDNVKIGDELVCGECGVKMILTECEDGVIRWRGT